MWLRPSSIRNPQQIRGPWVDGVNPADYPRELAKARGRICRRDVAARIGHRRSLNVPKTDGGSAKHRRITFEPQRRGDGHTLSVRHLENSELPSDAAFERAIWEITANDLSLIHI